MNKRARVQIKDMNIKKRLDLYTTGVDKSEGQYPSILYLYPKHLFYLTCGQAISKAVA
jgi:hypothetical protein